MVDEKKIKREVLEHACLHPEAYFPVNTLKAKGFARYQCSKCNRFFWATKASKVCGDPACSGGFRFIGDSPAKKKLDYIEVWEKFAQIHKKLGYTPISRYPVVARWNPTVDFTIASIAAFQPYVVSGEIAPPANPLVIPQMCLRFSDIDNVGITGHCVAFVMMGETGFFPPKEYNVEKYMSDHLTWLHEGMGIPFNELTIHEDVWSGGGNLGPCMEFFSRGLEISNQVYMQYEITPSGALKDLNIKVLDMGQGQERAAWFTQGKASVYECIFPTVLKKMRERTGVEYDEAFMRKFTPLAPYLNVGEVTDMESAWKYVASQLKMEVHALKDKLLPLAAQYAVAEHSRALLFAIHDGALPSNVGGMYNLRVILRRALGFIAKYGWKLSLPELCKWHAEYLKPMFPEVSQNLDEVAEILEVERKKYDATMEKTRQMLPRLIEKKLSTDDLIKLYDSQGITPELIQDEAAKLGKHIAVPENFYALVAARHEQKEQETATERVETLALDMVPPTEALYFEDYTKSSFDAKVLAVIDNMVVLDKTLFYPVSGGQLSDRGTLNGEKVVDVFKQGTHIVHVMESKPKFHAGDKVHGDIDFSRRLQLAQHHTSTHIVNAAARKVLGLHVNQASAKKDVDKAHLDITHYENLTDEQLAKIEEEANKIVKQGIKTKLSFVPREQAEREFGMAIYQGGVAPGKLLRIVNIPGIDVEACGGTHLKSTLEAGHIKIIKANKVKDGIVRITFAAGRAAENIEQQQKAVLDKAAALLKCKFHEVPGRALELFELWKKAKKAVQKKQPLPDISLKSKEEFKGDLLAKTAENLQTQPEFVVKTIERFLADLEKFKAG